MNKYVRKGLILLLWLSIWTLAALWTDNSILFVTPRQAAVRLFELLGERAFYVSVGRSLLHIALGFFAGFTAAVLLAPLALRFCPVEEFLSPFMHLLKAIPVASFVVLLLIWWGSSFLSVAICFLVVLPNLYINTLEGLKNTDKKLLEMAHVFRLPFKNRFFYIYRPALKPFLYSGMKISLGMCWKSGVAAEIIGLPDFSIGERLYLSKIYLDTAGVFAWTAVIILLSFLFEKLVMKLTDLFFSWQPACRRAHGNGRGRDDGQGREVQLGSDDKQDREVQQSRDAEQGSTIRISGLCKSFDGQIVLSGVSAEFARGGVYYLRQPSGSGKTTLLRLMAGLLKPDAGSVRAPDAVSMLFQEDRLCEQYSAVKNVELVCGDRKQAAEALERLLDADVLDRPCGTLSGGMKRRVALARAMEADSEAVLLDEPFTGMDAETRARAEEYIFSRADGRTLIIATHI
jgi:NitT/TauT family transport system permease protein